MATNRELLDSIQQQAERLKPHLDGQPTDRELVELDEQLTEILDSYE